MWSSGVYTLSTTIRVITVVEMLKTENGITLHIDASSVV